MILVFSHGNDGLPLAIFRATASPSDDTTASGGGWLVQEVKARESALTLQFSYAVAVQLEHFPSTIGFPWIGNDYFRITVALCTAVKIGMSVD